MKELPFRALALGLLLLSSILAACGESVPLTPVTVTEEDQGRTIELQVGQRLTIALRGEVFGRSWQVSEVDEAVLEYEGRPSVFNTSDSDRVALHFTALEPGETPVHVEWRLIGGDEIHSYDYQVVVR